MRDDGDFSAYADARWPAIIRTLVLLGTPAAVEVATGALARLRGTLVLMMAVENAPLIAEVLLRGGREATTPVGVVCDGTMPTQRTVLSTLGDLAHDLVEEQVKPPAIIVIGDVVAVAHPERYPASS